MAYRVGVRGRVQRVGYRRFVLDLAQDLGLAGYVVNERDGSVTIFAQGPDEVLKGFLEAVREPPRGVVVRKVVVEEVAPDPALEYFEVKFGSVQEELQESFGGVEREFGNYREEFSGFSRRTDENFRLISEKYGEISEGLKAVLEALIRESRETRERLAEAMEMLAEAIRLLKGS